MRPRAKNVKPSKCVLILLVTKKETSVEFTFEHQGKIYYIKRQPKQVLAGRGGKPVEKKAKVELIYPGPNKEKLAIQKIPEARRFIDELLHLTAEQFTKSHFVASR